MQHHIGIGDLVPYPIGQIAGSLGDMRIGDQQQSHTPKLTQSVSVRARPTALRGLRRPEYLNHTVVFTYLKLGQRRWRDRQLMREGHPLQ
ncbi:MAG: hypothetical protein NVSMB60_19330 [Mycobacterium sp.]